MLRFFRNIRKKLIEQENTRKYIWYALGEILLVMIGILLALQVNNWNEGRLENQKKEQYIRSMVSDLQQDSIALSLEIKGLSEELVELESYNFRLSSVNANLDTALYIARFEYLPFFDPSNELNRNTIISLLSTGDLNLFDEHEKNIILAHNTLQVRQQKIMDDNVDIFLSILSQNGILFGPMGNSVLESYVITGKLSDDIWNSFEGLQILKNLTTAITSKMLMYRFIRSAKQNVLDSTENVLSFLKAEYPDVHLE